MSQILYCDNETYYQNRYYTYSDINTSRSQIKLYKYLKTKQTLIW